VQENSITSSWCVDAGKAIISRGGKGVTHRRISTIKKDKVRWDFFASVFRFPRLEDIDIDYSNNR